MQEKNTTKKAIEVAGGPVKVAKRFELTTGAVIHWQRKDKVPAANVVDLCHMTRGVFQPHQLRPDVFDPAVRV